jgi:Holliday junction resolvase RusA-like endonuclease
MTTTSKVAVRLSLPFAPVPSPRPRVRVIGKFASVYMPKEYMDWKAEVAAHVARQPGLPSAELLERPVSVSLAFHVERPKTTKLAAPKPDIDNYAKSVLDAFNDAGVIWKDDTQVVTLAATKQWAEGPPRIDVQITYR